MSLVTTGHPKTRRQAEMARKPKRSGRLLRKSIRIPEDTGHTVSDIAAVLAGAKEPQGSPKAVRNLPRESIVVAEKDFQWRLTNEDIGARDDHILELANIIAATGKPLDARAAGGQQDDKFR